MGEYSDWLAEKTRDLPISEIRIAIFPEAPRRYMYTKRGKVKTPEYKAFLEDVRRASILPTRRAIFRSGILN